MSVDSFVNQKFACYNTSIKVRYGFVTHSDGGVVSAENLREMNPNMLSALVVPSLLSSLAESCDVTFFLIPLKDYKSLVEQVNGHVYNSKTVAADVDSVLQKFSRGTLIL